MKKLTSQYKQYLICKSRYALNKKNKATRLHGKHKRQLSKREVSEKSETTTRISAPENFVLGYSASDAKLKYPASRVKLLGFIAQIKQSLRAGKKVHITFKRTKLLAPSGTLVFVAELERIVDKYPGRVTIDYPNDDVVEQLFQHIGLLKRLGLTSRKVITAENVRHWNYVYGTNVDTTEFRSLFERYSSEISEDVRSGLFEGMSEAVTNSFQHAYPCEHTENCNCAKGWWMFAKQTDEVLTVVMYDAGIGIPASLRSKPEIKELLVAPYRRLKKQRDTALIDIAVESHRSITKLSHRGKGLPDMLEFVEQSQIGGFTIFSGRGAFSHTATDHIESSRDFDFPIIGTLIQWEIPLTSTT